MPWLCRLEEIQRWILCQVLKPYSCIWKCRKSCSQHDWQADSTAQSLCRLHLGKWGPICSCHTWINRCWEYLLNWFSPAPTRPMEVAAGIPTSPWQPGEWERWDHSSQRVSGKGFQLCQPLPWEQMKRGLRGQRLLFQLSILGKATDFLTFKLFRGFETFVCKLLEIQGSQRTSTCLLYAKSKYIYNPQVLIWRQFWTPFPEIQHKHLDGCYLAVNNLILSWVSQWSPKRYSFIALNLNILSKNST